MLESPPVAVARRYRCRYRFFGVEQKRLLGCSRNLLLLRISHNAIDVLM